MLYKHFLLLFAAQYWADLDTQPQLLPLQKSADLQTPVAIAGNTLAIATAV